MMDPTVGGGLIFGGLILLWLIQQDRRTIVSLVVVAAMAFVMSMLPTKADRVPQRVSSGQVQR